MMAITKEKKVALLESYKSHVDQAKNIVVIQQSAIPVNEMNSLRMQIAELGAKLQVVKKRLFLNQIKDLGFESVELDTLEGSVVVLYSMDDEFAPLKAIEKVSKVWKKSKAKYNVQYIGGWYDKQWKDADYVNSMANLPSKEELVGKFMYLMNYPLQSFVMVLDQISKQKSE